MFVPMGRGRVRPSRAMSAITIPVFAAFVALGVWLALWTGQFGGIFAFATAFGGLFTLVSASLLTYHVVNVVRPGGAALFEVDASADHGAGADERLRRLERMRDEGLVTAKEYEEKRKEILRGL